MTFLQQVLCSGYHGNHYHKKTKRCARNIQKNRQNADAEVDMKMTSNEPRCRVLNNINTNPNLDDYHLYIDAAQPNGTIVKELFLRPSLLSH